MEKSRKNLKEASILVLIFAALSLVRSIFDLIFGIQEITPDPAKGITEGVILAAIIIYAVFGLLLLIPQVYIGLKGIKISKNPDSSRAHIVWAKVLFVLCIICIAAPVADMIEKGDIVVNVLELCDLALAIIIYFMFIKYASEVNKLR